MLKIKVLEKSMDGEKVKFAVSGWEIPQSGYQAVTGEQALVMELLRQLGYWGKQDRLSFLRKLIEDSTPSPDLRPSTLSFDFGLRGKPSEEDFHKLSYDGWTESERLETFGPRGERR